VESLGEIELASWVLKELEHAAGQIVANGITQDEVFGLAVGISRHSLEVTNASSPSIENWQGNSGSSIVQKERLY
jgi:hypothetical protein